MIDDLALGEDFLQECIAATVEDFANFLSPGGRLGILLIERVGVPFCKNAFAWLQTRSKPQQQKVLDQLTRMSNEGARTIAETELNKTRLREEEKAELTNYFSAIPMTARRAITRYNDKGTPTTLLSQLPQNFSDLQRFIPTRVTVRIPS